MNTLQRYYNNSFGDFNTMRGLVQGLKDMDGLLPLLPEEIKDRHNLMAFGTDPLRKES